ncbi:MAG: RNA polymerase sigma factor [Terriglobales bacterium]
MVNESEAIGPGELLQRLTLYSYAIFGCFPQAKIEPALRVSGKSPEDLAMDVLTRYYDAGDAAVRWDPERGSLLAYLKTVLWHDFLDLKRAGLYRSASEAPESFDTLTGPAQSPELLAQRRQQRWRLLEQLADEPELEAIAALQTEEEGWPGYSNQELAAKLGTTVPEIENRKKRLLRRLLRLWRQATPVAAAVK